MALFPNSQVQDAGSRFKAVPFLAMTFNIPPTLDESNAPAYCGSIPSFRMRLERVKMDLRHKYGLAPENVYTSCPKSDEKAGQIANAINELHASYSWALTLEDAAREFGQSINFINHQRSLKV